MFSGIHNLAYPSILYAVYCIIESRGGKFILCGKQNPYSKEKREMRREAQYRGIIPFIPLPGVKFEMNEGGKDLGVP